MPLLVWCPCPPTKNENEENSRQDWEQQSFYHGHSLAVYVVCVNNTGCNLVRKVQLALFDLAWHKIVIKLDKVGIQNTPHATE